MSCVASGNSSFVDSWSTLSQGSREDEKHYGFSFLPTLASSGKKNLYLWAFCDHLLGVGAKKHQREGGPLVWGILRLLGRDMLEAKIPQEGSTEQELVQVEGQTCPVLGLSEMVCSSVFRASSHPTCAS